LVYGGVLGTPAIARAHDVPYIMVLEYDLRTQLVMAQTDVPNPLRRGVRAARCALRYAASALDMRLAHSLHCNGYPIFDETRWFNPNRLLYLDSRMSSDLVIDAERLHKRLATARRPMRLLFSGRYERVKGADDAVRVALACIARGVDVEMHCYGQGRLRAEMSRLAAQGAPGRIQIHDAIPYPELVERSREFDLFVCCHIQSDPSCTYLEAFGAGLPVVGYGNRMWQRLSSESAVGYVSPMGAPEAVAEHVARLSANPQTLAEMSERARRFAAEHAFEHEFSRRCEAINRELERAPSARQSGRGAASQLDA